MLYFISSEWLLQTKVAPKTHFLLRAEIFHQKPTINTIFGDSQMRDGVNFLPRFTNFSAGSQNYDDMRVKIQKYYHNETKPFQVILHAAPNNFAPYRNRPASQDVYDFYMQDNTQGPFMMTAYFQQTAWRLWKNYWDNDFTIIGRSSRFNEDGSTTVFGRFDKLSRQEKEHQAKMTIEHYRPYDQPQNTKAYKDLVSILSFLQDKGAFVCLVVSPMQEQAKAYFLADKSVQKTMMIFEDLSKEFSLQYLNFYTHKYADKYFDDTTHLNEEGARKFTKEIEAGCF